MPSPVHPSLPSNLRVHDSPPLQVSSLQRQLEQSNSHAGPSSRTRSQGTLDSVNLGRNRRTAVRTPRQGRGGLTSARGRGPFYIANPFSPTWLNDPQEAPQPSPRFWQLLALLNG